MIDGSVWLRLCNEGALCMCDGRGA